MELFGRLLRHPGILSIGDKNISLRIDSVGRKRDDRRLGRWGLYRDDPVVSFTQGIEFAARKNRETGPREPSGIKPESLYYRA
jgi:hypothetical protein